MQLSVSPSSNKKICAGLLALVAWFSLILQFYLRDQSVINFFSYFTILCNLLIAVSLSFSWLAPASGWGHFFSSLSVQSAIALYIFIVFVVYNLVLRGLLVLTGWRYFVDNMLHVVIPLLYLLYWIFFRTPGSLHWRDALWWAVFPLLYLAYSLLRGPMVNWYPYPFLNLGKLGYGSVLVNAGMVLVVFLLAGFILILLTRKLQRSR